MRAGLLTREKVANHGRLACFLQQKAVVPIGSVDHMELDLAAAGAQCDR